ncbi:MAG: hypothetical protein HY658_13385 [Actinobacteria bacterium]|nr:hypothetical protein [Actinomycetota bacterium]
MESKARARRRTKQAPDPFGFDAPGERRPSAAGAAVELASLYGDEFPVPERAGSARSELPVPPRPGSGAEWVEQVDGSIRELLGRIDELSVSLRGLAERLARIEAHGRVTQELSRTVGETLQELLRARSERGATAGGQAPG